MEEPLHLQLTRLQAEKKLYQKKIRVGDDTVWYPSGQKLKNLRNKQVSACLEFISKNKNGISWAEKNHAEKTFELIKLKYK